MAVSDYTELKDAVADWLNRKDLTNRIPDFIRLFEAKASRRIRTADTLQRANAVVNNGFFPVPVDWRETVDFMRLTPTPLPLTFVSTAKSYELRARQRTGPVTHYTHIGRRFYLIPEVTADVELELLYRAAIPPLTDDEPVNWLLTASPDLYLFGALAEAEPYLKNDERVVLWASKAEGIFEEMRMEAERAKYPQGSLAVKGRTFG